MKNSNKSIKPLEGKVAIPNHEPYYLDLENNKVLKKRPDGLFQTITPIKVGGNLRWRLTINSERKSYSFNELHQLIMRKAVDSVSLDKTEKEEVKILEKSTQPLPTSKKESSEVRGFKNGIKKSNALLEEKPEVSESAKDVLELPSLQMKIAKNAGKLSLKDILEIKSLLNTDIKQCEIADRFDVDPTVISKIKRGVLFGQYLRVVEADQVETAKNNK